MTETGSRKVEILQDALDLPPTERAAFVERECGTDAVLLKHVQALLAADTQGWDLLDQPLDALAAEVFSSAGDDSAYSGNVGQLFGPWRLIRELGRGGMGSVWLAERADGQFTQQVALKLIKLGMDSVHVQNQFRREREALARLQHPNIAQLIDGGADENGRLWFAMELVEGVGLREWIDSAPPLRARLTLFVKLCGAVAHAHQQLVVHRDLKPSNVMVQADGEPRLLDFGIAKLLEDSEDATQTLQRFATRAYAAPEQVQGKPVTTVTDVYALGILLFELLTGAHYSGHNKSTNPITRPSHVAGRAPAQDRAIPSRMLRGDLDAITMRALAEEPERRYPGAGALASDVQRFLRGQPVKARPDSLRYRAVKFLRRNRAASAAVAIAVIALVSGSIISWTQMQRAEAMAQRAEVMAQRAERGQEFFAGLLRDADPFNIEPDRRVGPDRLFDNALARIERDFADVPEVQINLRSIIVVNLGRSGNDAKYLELSQRNVAAARQYYGEAAPETGITLTSLGIAQRRLHDEAGALASLTLAERLLRDVGPDQKHYHISAMTGLAALANQNGELAEAWRLRQAILHEREALDGTESPDLAMDLMGLSVVANYDERYLEAEALAQRAHDMIVKLLGPDHARLLYVDNALGVAQANAGHTAEGVATLTKIVNQIRAKQPNAPILAQRLGALASVQLLAGSAVVAIDLSNEALEIADRAAANRTFLVSNLGRAQLVSGHPGAEQSLREAVLAMSGSTDGNLGRLEQHQAALGLAEVRNGKNSAGEARTRQARADLMAGRWASTTKLGDINLYLADILDANGTRDEEARSLRGEALAVFERVLGPDHPRTRALKTQL